MTSFLIDIGIGWGSLASIGFGLVSFGRIRRWRRSRRITLDGQVLATEAEDFLWARSPHPEQDSHRHDQEN